MPWAAVVTLVLLWLSILSGLKSLGGFRRELSGVVAAPLALRWAGLAPSAVIPAVFLIMWLVVIAA